MSSKLGLILSMFFASIFFLMCSDLVSIQYIYSDLDSKSISISYRLSKADKISADIISEICNSYEVQLVINDYDKLSFGDEIIYILKTKFDPMIISSDEIVLSIKRSTYIGYLG